MDPRPSTSSSRDLLLRGALPACLAAALLLAPALFAGFFGDDFILWHFGKRLIEEPSTALIGPDNFYRPANSWLFATHHLLFGTEPLGYHVGTLLMHLGCGALLGMLVGRFAPSTWAVFGASLVWMISPYAFEPVQFVNVAYNDLTVLLIWLALAVLWPAENLPWSRRRLAAVVGLVALSVFCKESWVIVPGLIVAFERFIARAGWRRVLRSGLVSGIPVAAYVLAYPWIFPGRDSYYDVGWWVAARVPHLFSIFSMVTPLQPYRTEFRAIELVGLLLILACAWLGMRRKSSLIGLGFAFFAVSIVPILFIPYLPTRYTTVPLVGFVLVLTGALREILILVPERRRRPALAGVVALVLVALGANLIRLQGDFEDMKLLREPYTALVNEVTAFADRIPTDRPVVCVRLEEVDALKQLHAQGSHGVPKLYFQRNGTPYGLANWAELLTFARAGRGDEFLVYMDPNTAPEQPYAVIGHAAGGFVTLDPRAETIRDEMYAWLSAGYRPRLVGPYDQATAAAEVAGLDR